MTSDEWESVVYVMESCWKGGFGDEEDRKADAYRMFLNKFSAEEVMAGLHSLAEDGSPFLPSVPEIVQRVRALTEPPVPSWPEVWKHLMVPVRRGWPEQQALDYLNERHPLMGHFMGTVGYEYLRTTGFDDPDYGGIRIKELEGRWNEFVGTAKDRLVQGRALEAAGMRRGVGPARIDQAALLEQLGAPKELEA